MDDIITELLGYACAVLAISFVGWLHIEFWLLIFEHVRFVW